MIGGLSALGGGALSLLEVILQAVRSLYAHVGGLSQTASDPTVPSWLTVVTGGVLVGGSFLFTSLLTDHEGIRAVNGWTVGLPMEERLASLITAVGRLIGVGILAGVLVAGFLGPREPTQNVAILVVWVAWWGGFTMSTYLIGNTWPVLNPWRTLAEWLPGSGGHDFPERLGVWPSVVALLALIWVEVVSPLAEDPTALGLLILGYTGVTLLGAHRYGIEPWFERVDPLTRVFQLYGHVAPLQFTDDGVEWRLPGTALTETDPAEGTGETAFVIALLWATTFDGVVTTAVWNDTARTIVEAIPVAGIAQRVVVLSVYLVALIAGFAIFFGAYRWAARYARETADSYLSPETIGRWLVPSLLPIAAGYHLAHTLGYFLSLAPALTSVLLNPVGGSQVVNVATLPAWFGTLQLGFVVLGHLLAVWIAHAIAMELFPGVLRPIRSQYPFVIVMMVYTMTSAFVVGQPFIEPAYL